MNRRLLGGAAAILILIFASVMIYDCVWLWITENRFITGVPIYKSILVFLIVMCLAAAGSRAVYRLLRFALGFRDADV